MKIVAVSAGIARSKLASGLKANGQNVQKWLVDNVHWGLTNCPDVATVEGHMANSAAIENNPGVMELIESAGQRWGRNNLLDWPTKLSTIVSKTDGNSIGYVVEALYADMWQRNEPDPYGAKELQKIIADILWTRTYVKNSVARYRDAFKPLAEDGSTCTVVKKMLNRLLTFFLKTKGPERDRIW